MVSIPLKPNTAGSTPGVLCLWLRATWSHLGQPAQGLCHSWAACSQQHRYVTPKVGTSLDQGSPPCFRALALNSGLKAPQLHLHSVTFPAETTLQSRLWVTAVLSPLELSCHPSPAECLPGPQWDCAPLGSPMMSVLLTLWGSLSPFKVSICLLVSSVSPVQLGSARVPRWDWGLALITC